MSDLPCNITNCLSGPQRTVRFRRVIPISEQQSCPTGGVDKLASHLTPPATPKPAQAEDPICTLAQPETSHISGMDDDEQRRRQAEQTSYRQSFHENTPYGGTVTPGVGNSRGRPSTRPTDGTRHPHSISSPGSVPNITGYGYAAEQQYPPQQPQGQPFAYQSEYSANPQRVQPYSQYPQQMIYNVPQHGQVHDQSPLAFSNAPPYLQRQSTAVEVLATHFGGQSYYNPGETQVSAAPSSYPAPSFQHSMQYPSQTDFSQAPLIPNYPLNPHLAISESEPAQRQQQQAIQDPFTAHRQLLRRTNSLTIQGRLREARNPLLAMSQRLLDQIEILGMRPPRSDVCPR